MGHTPLFLPALHKVRHSRWGAAAGLSLDPGGEGHGEPPAEFEAGDVWHDWGRTTTITDEPTGVSITIGSFDHYVEGPDGELETWTEMVVIERDTGCATGSEVERVNALFDAIFASVPQE